MSDGTTPAAAVTLADVPCSAAVTLDYVCDARRHLVCRPFSVEGLHRMAADLGIKRCWYHPGRFPHYDIPKRRIAEITARCELVSSRELLLTITRAP